MKFAFVGDYLLDYNRTKIIRSGLLKLGHEVVDFSFKKKNSTAKEKIRELSKTCDVFFMPSFTHQQVKFVKRILKNEKPLIFDPLISRYLTKVHDYKLVSAYSLSALRNYFRDKLPMMAADFVVTDTEQHREYFHQKFSIPLEKMGVLYIGNDFEEFFPADRDPHNSKFTVGFYGGFIPLQGVMNILKAAQILQSQTDIQFELIGNGFEYDKALRFISDNKLGNVSTPGWLTTDQLREKLQNYDMTLGIFGETDKSNLVIPNKVYHYASCRKAILTKESPAMKEIFQNNEDLLLCSTKPEDIATNILKLKNEPELRKKLAENIYTKMKQHYNAEAVARQLVLYAEDLV